jgi:hypothetical protein
VTNTRGFLRKILLRDPDAHEMAWLDNRAKRLGMSIEAAYEDWLQKESTPRPSDSSRAAEERK